MTDPAPPPLKKRIVIGVTGASGAVYARRTVQLLVASGVETHVVVSALGQRLLHDELGIEGGTGMNLRALAGLPEDAPVPDHLIGHNVRDVGATIASGSFTHDGMLIVPCSSNTLSSIATGQAQNLIHRAAHVTLKERRRLVLLHRETPLSLIDARNIVTVTEAGAIVAPASPGFYLNPKRIEDLVDFVAGRALDLLNIPHNLAIRWPPPPEVTPAQPITKGRLPGSYPRATDRKR